MVKAPSRRRRKKLKCLTEFHQAKDMPKISLASLMKSISYGGIKMPIMSLIDKKGKKTTAKKRENRRRNQLG